MILNLLFMLCNFKYLKTFKKSTFQVHCVTKIIHNTIYEIYIFFNHLMMRYVFKVKGFENI